MRNGFLKAVLPSISLIVDLAWFFSALPWPVAATATALGIWSLWHFLMPSKHPIAEPSKALPRPPEPQTFQLPGFERHWVPPCDESESRQLHQDVLRDIANGGLAPDVVNRTFIQQEAQRICDWVDWQILTCLERYPGMDRSTIKNRYFTQAMHLIERGRLLHYAELAPQILEIVERTVAQRFSRAL